MADIKSIFEIEEGVKVTSNEQGVCPVCGCEELEYGVAEFEDDGMIYYPVTCSHCGTTYNEWYSLSFASNDQIRKGE